MRRSRRRCVLAEDPADEGDQDVVMPLIYADIEPDVEALRAARSTSW
jgi:hypothetical protein